MILLFLLLLFVAPYTAIADTGQNLSRVKAVQILYTPSADYQEFEAEIIRMKRSGINTVIFRVFGNKGDRIHKIAMPDSTTGVYYSTTHAPVIDDVLAKVTEITHSHGMKLYAWMTTRYAIYGASDDMLDKEYTLSKGEEVQVKKLDLFNPRALKHLESLYEDLAKYPIDGVLFQDDFIIKHMEGFGTSAKLEYMFNFKKVLDPKKMYAEIELKPTGKVERIRYTEEFYNWASWKNDRLAFVAQKLIHVLKAKNPKIKTVFNAYYEVFRKPQNAFAWQSINAELAKKFDYVAVMTYHRQMMEELRVDTDVAVQTIKEITKRSIQEVGDPKRVIVKVQSLDWTTRKQVPKEEMDSVYQAINSVSKDVGIAFVPWEGNLDINIAGKESERQISNTVADLYQPVSEAAY